jgi:ribonuclease HI
MNDPIDLDTIAYKAERSAGKRLARSSGLSDADALRRTLELRAGRAGLPALIAERLALRAVDAARAAARAALRSTLRADAKARHDARHGQAAGARPHAWQAWFDGSARPNPGRCAIGVLLVAPDGRRIELARTVGDGDSSDAEYRALIALLEAALAAGATDLAIHGDSRVVIDDLHAPDASAAPSLHAHRATARALLARFGHATLRWVPRHRNGEADALSQRAFAPAPSLTQKDHDV